MRKLATVAIASMLFAGVASAQFKAQQQARPTTQPASPVQIQSSLQPAAEPPIESARRIPRDEAIKLVKEKKAVFVDVRSKESYDAGHIPGAYSVPLSEIESNVSVALSKLPPKRFIVTYCA